MVYRNDRHLFFVWLEKPKQFYGRKSVKSAEFNKNSILIRKDFNRIHTFSANVQRTIPSYYIFCYYLWWFSSRFYYFDIINRIFSISPAEEQFFFELILLLFKFVECYFLMRFKMYYIFFFSVKGRECNTHADCSSLQFTSCVKDLDDDKLRCLCGDNKAPINGLCTANKRGKL